MNADLLLKHYERIADAPDAIVRLRRFILDLAVRGKLVAQDRADAPASELLKHVTREKERLQIRDRTRVSTPKDAHNFDESAIPFGWAAVTAHEIFPTRSGNSKLIKGTLHAEAGDGLFPGYSAAGQDVWLDHWEHEGRAIILSAVGARCGKAFLAEGKWSAVANTHIIWLLPSITLPAFAMLHLNNESFWTRSGGAQPFVKVTETLAKQFLLPPLAEQYRIVAKVDELMALCDRLEAARAEREAVRDRLAAASLARLNTPHPETFQADARFALEELPALTTRPDQIKHLRQTILNLAMRGKLVQQDPNDEPVAKALERIRTEKARLVDSGVIRKPKPTDQLSTDDLPYEVPHGWTWVRLEELAHKISDGEHLSPNKTASGMPLLTATHVSERGLTLERPQFVSLEDGYRSRQRCDPRRGDILICSRGTIGRCAIVDVDDVFCLMGSVIQVRLPPECSAAYFNYFLSTDWAQKRMRGMSGATAVQALYLKDIRHCPMPVAPIAEQARIAAQVGSLMSLCDRLEASLKDASDSRLRLLDAVLAEALVGNSDRREAA